MNSPMNMMVAILISIFGLVSASFDYDGRPTLEDVQKFYRSRENIYVLRRSFKLEDESGDSPKCIWNKRVDGDVFKLQEAYVVGLTVKKWSSVIHFSILRPTATMCCRNLLRRYFGRCPIVQACFPRCCFIAGRPDCCHGLPCSWRLRRLRSSTYTAAFSVISSLGGTGIVKQRYKGPALSTGCHWKQRQRTEQLTEITV
ncbi:uncharacterized protein LOC142796415 isoform X3 [Rhipicephalus microplus]|uniref:uncharacterized protein LOC142796415 isoform X3 n=1 Tax=Rhipicephalus microplus TaxID=6941 RepID=UPI003F6AA2CC